MSEQAITSPLLVLLALALGAAIGAEREWRQHAGGLRTCTLIAAASCVFIRLIALHGGPSLSPGIGAVATGVGFLGAGVMQRRETGEVVGLSTAATFWGTAAVGSAVGLLEFGLAALLTAGMLVAQEVLRPLSAWVARHPPAPKPPQPR